MIINDKEAAKRLDSSNNLINRLKSKSVRASAMDLFGLNRKNVEVKKIDQPEAAKQELIVKVQEIVKSTFNPFDKTPEPSPPPQVEDLINNSETAIKLSLAHDTALELLTNSVSMLKNKLEDRKSTRLNSS